MSMSANQLLPSGRLLVEGLISHRQRCIRRLLPQVRPARGITKSMMNAVYIAHVSDELFAQGMR